MTTSHPGPRADTDGSRRGEEHAVDAEVFRSAFRRHPAGVVVITADAGSGPVGFTASSLVSVSLQPPLIAFTITTGASSWPTIGSVESLVVNFLAAGQASIARCFAQLGADRFSEPTRWSRLPTGEPVLDEAPGHLRVVVENRWPVGDHRLVVACVVDHAGRSDYEPLIYHDGGYTTVDRGHGGDASLQRRSSASEDLELPGPDADGSRA
ncbi:flavin reductase family protein [Kribbella albertanoniae]|uniref:Flavin reductase n=1 Tax=Kribbella albertanoniae TaxID=1266829 RepID=A0A4R4QIJ2_9ACTN|nr:flavin reductase family protein [Kribbella albertanoniae]TDC35498.1 flavin reductase [Kribbella albertanoniae]